ncbi:hypothetical protein [Nonlabens sp.]|uniref:hypothetical protein n=1 Tax=Nonlabens sp. TaxID=1888209 RepID=UPI0025F6ADC2|nr:hypothetical protein [Nonlabens sp.]
MNNPNEIELYNFIQNPQQNELRNNINNFIRSEYNSQEAQGFALEAIMVMEEDPNTEIDFDDKIINELSASSNLILNRLNSGNNNIKDYIQGFDGDFPVSHLKFTINNNLPSTVYGETQVPSNFTTEIQINELALVNLSDLGVALVFVHEILHAEMFRKLLEASASSNLNPNNRTYEEEIQFLTNLSNNYPGLYDYYYQRFQPNWQHNLMAAHYRSRMALMLLDFDNSRLPLSVYQDICWVGIRTTSNGNTTPSWVNVSASDRNRIIQNINDNFYNGPNTRH